MMYTGGGGDGDGIRNSRYHRNPFSISFLISSVLDILFMIRSTLCLLLICSDPLIWRKCPKTGDGRIVGKKE